eukprot:scaffold100173_cov85-Cyclotella_meneghiniana.AAC.2
MEDDAEAKASQSPELRGVLMCGNSGKCDEIARIYLAREAIPSHEIGRTAGKNPSDSSFATKKRLLN